MLAAGRAKSKNALGRVLCNRHRPCDYYNTKFSTDLERNNTKMATLSYEVLVLDGTPRAGDQRLPSGEAIVSSPLAITLVSGEHDAVLVDAPYTFGQIERVRNWIEDSGKTLRYVYITHAHGDHWLGAGELLSSFPEAQVLATPGTLGRMEHEATVGREKLWDVAFPGLVPPSPVIAQPVSSKVLKLRDTDSSLSSSATPTLTIRPPCGFHPLSLSLPVIRSTTAFTSMCLKPRKRDLPHGSPRWTRSQP